MNGLNGLHGTNGLHSTTGAAPRIAAEAETAETGIPQRAPEAHRGKNVDAPPQSLLENLPKHSFPAAIQAAAEATKDAAPVAAERAKAARPWQTADEFHAGEQERRIYRGRTVAMLRRYMKYSIETGRLPSLLGREFFRAKVTSYTVVTFEDRVIFVHDMEACLDRLDEFSRELIARHILQEHDRWATAKLLACNEKTVRRLTPLALDQLSQILLDRGLLERVDSTEKNSCQGGAARQSFASDCEQDK